MPAQRNEEEILASKQAGVATPPKSTSLRREPSLVAAAVLAALHQKPRCSRRILTNNTELSVAAILPLGRKRPRTRISSYQDDNNSSGDDEDDEYEGDEKIDEDSDDEALVTKMKRQRKPHNTKGAKSDTVVKKAVTQKANPKVTAIKKLLSTAGVPESCVAAYAVSLVDSGIGTKTKFHRLEEVVLKNCAIKKGHARLVMNSIRAEAAAKISDSETDTKVSAVGKLLCKAGVPECCVDEYANAMVRQGGVGTKTMITKVVKKSLLVRCAVVVFTGLGKDAPKTLKKCGVKTGHIRLIARLITSTDSLKLLGTGNATKRKRQRTCSPSDCTAPTGPSQQPPPPPPVLVPGAKKLAAHPRYL
jgi:hypothetical protein